MPNYGRYVSSRDFEWGAIGTTDQRASVYNAMPENGWGTHIGGWLGKVPAGSNSTVQLAVWTTDASKNPVDLMCYTAGITVSVALGDNTGETGDDYVGAVANVDSALSPGTNAIKLEAGKRYSIGFVATVASLRHSMIQSSRLGSAADNKLFYDHFSTSTPLDPNGYTYTHTEGWCSLWIVYVTNRAPVAAVVSPSGIITSATPDFVGSFTDADSTYGDKLKSYRIWVRRKSDLAAMWTSSTFSASSGEQAAAQFTRAYGGSALSQGVEYEWQCQVSDQFGEWSAITAWQSFTVSSGGTLTPSSFSGKQTTQQPGPFVAGWVDGGALNADRARIYIKRGGEVVLDSGDLTISVASGANISISWATAFGTNALSWGVGDYSWEMKARNTATLWTDPTGLSFSTNAAPGIPSALSPANSAPSSSYPLLACSCSDADSDDTPATLTVKARIKNNAGTVLQTRTMTYNGTSGKFEYQTIAADLASFATYKWDAYSYDGDLYSGEQTVEASASKSSEAVFVYADGPVISISAPTASQVLTSSSVSVTWTLTSGGPQQSYQVFLYRDADDLLVYDSGEQVTATMSHTIPSGYVRDNTAYYVIVEVTSTIPLTALSSARAFSINYTEPAAPANFNATEQLQPFDASPSSVRLTWTATALAGYVQTIIGRRESGQDADNELILARLASQAITEWTDYHAAGDTDYVYSIRVSEVQGLDTVTSARSEFNVSLSLSNVVLVSIDDPVSSRVALVLEEDRAADLVDDLALEHAWGEAEPIASYGTTEYDVIPGRYRIVSDGTATAREYVAAARALRRRRGVVSYRDGRGRRIFGVISKFREIDARVENYELELDVTEVNHREDID